MFIYSSMQGYSWGLVGPVCRAAANQVCAHNCMRTDLHQPRISHILMCATQVSFICSKSQYKQQQTVNNAVYPSRKYKPEHPPLHIVQLSILFLLHPFLTVIPASSPLWESFCSWLVLLRSRGGRSTNTRLWLAAIVWVAVNDITTRFSRGVCTERTVQVHAAHEHSNMCTRTSRCCQPHKQCTHIERGEKPAHELHSEM